MATQASKFSPARSLNSSYEAYVNPQWVALLNILDMNVRYERCAGSELFADDGRRILDFLSGYCVHNTGHTHPYTFDAFHHVHPAIFGQIVVMRMLREKNILTQICGNSFMVLKAAPPLVVTEEQLDEFVCGIRTVTELAHTPAAFWSEALGLARRAAKV